MHLIKEEGFLSLYRGFFLSIFGLAPYLAITFTTYDLLKATFYVEKSSNYVLKMINFFGYGFASGILAHSITYPLDTIRYRFLSLWKI